MDCTTAAWVSVTGGAIELLGILTVAADLLYAGRVPNLKATIGKLLRRPPPVVYGRASAGSGLTARSTTRSSGQVLPQEPPADDVAGQLLRLERRIDELRADLAREATARAEAVARLERSIQPTLAVAPERNHGPASRPHLREETGDQSTLDRLGRHRRIRVRPRAQHLRDVHVGPVHVRTPAS